MTDKFGIKKHENGVLIDFGVAKNIADGLMYLADNNEEVARFGYNHAGKLYRAIDEIELSNVCLKKSRIIMDALIEEIKRMREKKQSND